MQRNVTHDGSDHSYRMTIENRYRTQVMRRKVIATTSLAQLIYVIARTVWKTIPVFLQGEQCCEKIHFGIYIFCIDVSLTESSCWWACSQEIHFPKRTSASSAPASFSSLCTDSPLALANRRKKDGGPFRCTTWDPWFL